MSFPTSPINGQIAVVNNVAYEYASANTSWTRVLSIANIIQANVISANVLNVVQAFSIVGNIATANYFIGNGAFLTGLPVTYSNTDVANYLPTYTGNLVSLTGPVTTTGNITGGNLLTNGVVSATGNITGNYILGNGSQLTGIDATSIQNGTSNVRVVSSGGNVAIGIGGTPNVAVFATTGEYVTGVISASGNITGGNISTSGELKSTGTFLIGTQAFYPQGSDGFSVNENFNAGNSTVTAYHYTSGTGRSAVVFDVAVTNQFTTGFGATGNAATNKFVQYSENANTTWEWRKNVGISAPNLNGGTLIANIDPNGNLYTIGTIVGTGNITGGNVNTNRVVGTGLTLVSTGDLTLSATGNINANNEYINNVPTPVADGDAVNKLYVDNFVTGLNVHDAVTAATPTTLATITSGTITYYNGPGSNGVGATLSTTGTFNLIDTVNVQTAGTRILVLNEANAVTNGVYVWSNATAITRASDYNSVPEVEAGDFMFVTNGATYGNTGWIQTSSVSNIGYAGNNITFTQFSGSGTYNAGTGLTLTGTTFSVNASQTQVTSVGTLGSLTVTANVTGGNVLTAGLITATGNITGGNLQTAGLISATGNITGGNFVGTLNGSGANVTSISATNISSGTLAQARLANAAVTLGSTALTLGSTVTTVAGLTSVTSTTFVGALTGAATSATTAGTVTTAAQPNITSVGTLSGLTINNATTAITNGAANGVGNIGSSSLYFNTVFAKATSAQYADLAEMYVADAEYPPGTVLEFGGSHEVTVSNTAASPLVAGVVSTNPAHLMNSIAQGEHLAAIALVGRVPTRVIGPVFKGAMMVSAGNGHAQACATPAMGTVIGKAVEDFVSASGTIEIAVGRL